MAEAHERPDLAGLERRLDYRFEQSALLERALTHSSFANDRGDADHNERLEFLGDSVIGLVVAHLLYEAHPAWPEGDLTRGLHALVERSALAALARSLALGEQVMLGRTERSSQGEAKESILADVMEAVIGAMYLDGGVVAVRALARRVFADALADGVVPTPRDPKTALQEQLMAQGEALPSYAVTLDSEVDGDDERFTVEVVIAGRALGSGTARSKKLAERDAAAVALEALASESAALQDE